MKRKRRIVMMEMMQDLQRGSFQGIITTARFKQTERELYGFFPFKFGVVRFESLVGVHVSLLWIKK